MDNFRRAACAVAIFAAVTVCIGSVYAERQSSMASACADSSHGCVVLKNVEVLREPHSAHGIYQSQSVESHNVLSARGVYALREGEPDSPDSSEDFYTSREPRVLESALRAAKSLAGKLRSTHKEQDPFSAQKVLPSRAPTAVLTKPEISESSENKSFGAFPQEIPEDLDEFLPEEFYESQIYNPNSPEEDLIFGIKRKGKILSNTLLGIQKGPRTFLPAKEIARLVDIYIDPNNLENIDQGILNGFFFSQSNDFNLNIPNGTYTVRGKTSAIPAEHVFIRALGSNGHEIYATPEFLNKLWALRLRFDYANLFLFIETPFLLPTEKAALRKEKQALLEFSDSEDLLDELNLKYVPNDYQAFGKPAVRITKSTNYTHERDQLSTNIGIRGKNDLLLGSANYNAQIRYNEDDGFDFSDFRLNLTRRADRGDELPFGLKEVQAGDISDKPPELIDNNIRGTGLKFTNRPFSRPQNFDRITVEGTAEPGWEVELYRTNTLLDVSVVEDNGEYVFTDVPLNFGKNTIKVILYGPEGQIEERVEEYRISNEMLAPGELFIEGSIINANDTLFNVRDEVNRATDGIFQTYSIKKGVNRWFTPFGTITRLERDDEERTYVTAGTHFSAFKGLGTFEAYRDLDDGSALDLRYASKFAGFRYNLNASKFYDFESAETGLGNNKKDLETSLRISRPIKFPFGKTNLDFGVSETRFEDDSTRTDIDTSQSIAINKVRINNQTNLRYVDRDHVSTNGRLSVNRSITKDLKARSFLGYELHPEQELKTSRLELRYFNDDGLALTSNLTRNFETSDVSTSLDASYDFDTFTGSAGTTWDVGEGFDFVVRMSTSLGPFGDDGSYIASSKSLTNKRALSARVYHDKDLSGTFTEGDEPLEGVQLFVNRLRTDPSDANGFIRDLTPGNNGLVKITVDRESLFNEFMVSRHDGYYTILRAITEPFIDIPVIETGAIDGTIYYADKKAAGGIRLTLVSLKNTEKENIEETQDQNIVQETVSDAFGFYNFDFVKPGEYEIQVHSSHEFSVQPVRVRVTSDHLFHYGTDIQVLEQAKEVKSSGAEEAQRERGIVPKLRDLLDIWTERLAPPTSGSEESAAVNRVRIGEHPGKVRFVLDLSGPADYEVFTSQDGRRVTLRLLKTGWNTSPSWENIKIPLIDRFETRAVEGENAIEVVLYTKAAVQTLKHDLIPPHKKDGHRIYLDLVAK